MVLLGEVVGEVGEVDELCFELVFVGKCGVVQVRVVLQLLFYVIEFVVEASYCCILSCYHLYQSTDLLLLYL